MTRTHVPVLAAEVIELGDPGPGDTVVDCTFGAGGHARLIADRIGPTGTLICIDRDPLAEEHFAELAREVTCETRFLRMDYADGLTLLREEGIPADVVYLDLGISSMQVDARERGFSYSYDAPLDMRMDPGQQLDASGRVILPAPLLDHTGIQKEVVVVGVGDHLEVWARERWQEQQDALDSEIGEVTERLGNPS